MGVIEDYQQALRDREAARSAATSIAGIVRQAGAAMEHWTEVMVSNLPPGDWPADIVLRRSTKTINGATWPTAEQIAKAFIGYHQAAKSAQESFERIPLEQRIGLEKP